MHVSYRGLQQIADDRRGVVIRFDSNNAPPVPLVVIAHDRPDYAVQPNGFTFRCFDGDADVVDRVDLENFSGVPWQGCTISSESPWLVASIERVDAPRVNDTAGLTDLWRVTARLRVEQVSDGAQNLELAIVARRPGREPYRVPIHVFVEKAPPADVRPACLFYARVKRGEEATRAVEVTFSRHFGESGAVKITVDGVPPTILSVDYKRVAADKLEVIGKLRPDAKTPHVLSATVRIVFSGPTPGEIAIPVAAIIEE